MHGSVVEWLEVTGANPWVLVNTVVHHCQPFTTETGGEGKRLVVLWNEIVSQLTLLVFTLTVLITSVQLYGCYVPLDVSSGHNQQKSSSVCFSTLILFATPDVS